MCLTIQSGFARTESIQRREREQAEAATKALAAAPIERIPSGDGALVSLESRKTGYGIVGDAIGATIKRAGSVGGTSYAGPGFKVPSLTHDRIEQEHS